MNPNLEKVLAKIRRAELTEFTGVDAKLQDPNEKGLFGTTPLHVIAIWGDVEVANILLDAGAEIDALPKKTAPLYTRPSTRAISKW